MQIVFLRNYFILFIIKHKSFYFAKYAALGLLILLWDILSNLKIPPYCLSNGFSSMLVWLNHHGGSFAELHSPVNARYNRLIQSCRCSFKWEQAPLKFFFTLLLFFPFSLKWISRSQQVVIDLEIFITLTCSCDHLPMLKMDFKNNFIHFYLCLQQGIMPYSLVFQDVDGRSLSFEEIKWFTLMFVFFPNCK